MEILKTWIVKIVDMHKVANAWQCVLTQTMNSCLCFIKNTNDQEWNI